MIYATVIDIAMASLNKTSIKLARHFIPETQILHKSLTNSTSTTNRETTPS